MKWIQQTDTAGERDEELRYYLSESHRLVAQGLSKRKQQELGLVLTSTMAHGELS
jgi:predicted DNA-binding protein (MmcQ/YjbR family)